MTHFIENTSKYEKIFVMLMDQSMFYRFTYKLPDFVECWIITTDFRVEDLKSDLARSRWKLTNPQRVKWIDGRCAANQSSINKTWDIFLLIELYRPYPGDKSVIENNTRQDDWFWSPFGSGEYDITRHGEPLVKYEKNQRQCRASSRNMWTIIFSWTNNISFWGELSDCWSKGHKIVFFLSKFYSTHNK